jgi:uncharacterized protein YqhQ
MILFQDVLRFMVIFLLIFVAFMVGLQNLYQYYSADHRSKVEKNKPITDDDNAVPATTSLTG